MQTKVIICHCFGLYYLKVVTKLYSDINHTATIKIGLDILYSIKGTFTSKSIKKSSLFII
jgi:hypothetical protein